MYKKTEKLLKYFYEQNELDELQKNKLIGLVTSSNTSVREKVAELMGIHYVQQYDESLYHLSFDKNILVKMEAVDSLALCCSERILKRLETLCYSNDIDIRQIALLSHYDVYTNIYGSEPVKRQEYLEWLTVLMKDESDKRTIIASEKIKYQIGNDESFIFMIDAFVDSVQNRNFGIQATTMNLLDEILDLENIATFMNKVTPYLEKMEPKLRDRIEGIEKTILMSENLDFEIN